MKNNINVYSRDGFTFEISCSILPVVDKSEYDWKNVVYCKKRVNQFELAELVNNGYVINSVFKLECVTCRDKTKYNFVKSNVIAFDFDNSSKTMEEFVSYLDKKPSICYTTPSDGKFGKHRFRLLYIFSKPFTDVNDYREYYYAIKDNCFKGEDTDDMMSSGVQNIGGGKRDSSPVIHENIYDLSDFTPLRQSAPVVHDCTCGLSKQFERDLYKLPFNEFHEKYRKIYPYITKSEENYNENGFMKLDENYIEIYRECRHVNGKWTPVRIKDGHGRRRKLYVQCKLRKQIKPDITLEHLVYCLVLEREWYFDNSDGVLDNFELTRIAENAMDDNTEIEILHKRNFKLDKQFWEEKGYTPKQAKQFIRRDEHWNEILKWYNPDLKDKDNLKIINEHGIKCSRTTLFRFKRAYASSHI